MKRNYLVLLAVLAATTVGCIFYWNSRSADVVAQVPERIDPLAPLNEKARVARAGGLTEAQEYVEEIISISGFQSELRGFTTTSIKDRVGRAESRFRLGHTEGVSEDRVVRTINGLAKKFDLPSYARTSSYEIRRLRLGLLPYFPQVISQKNSGDPPRSRGMRIESTLSPAEAMLVLTMMVQQKLANPEYQQTQGERLQTWVETHRRQGRGIIETTNQGRSHEIRTSLNRAASTVSASDALQLSNLVLNTLGIEQ